MISVLDNLVCRISLSGSWVSGCVRSLPKRLYAMFACRPFRVLVLSLAIAAMSGVDLYLTLLFVTQTGMHEMNPLARAMMEYQSPVILAVWKTATVVLSIGILILIRKQRSAEMGAWIGCLVMGWLMLHWTGFIHLSSEIDMELAQSADNPNWIIMSTQVEGLESVGSWIID